MLPREGGSRPEQWSVTLAGLQLQLQLQLQLCGSQLGLGLECCLGLVGVGHGTGSLYQFKLLKAMRD